MFYVKKTFGRPLIFYETKFSSNDIIIVVTKIRIRFRILNFNGGGGNQKSVRYTLENSNFTALSKIKILSYCYIYIYISYRDLRWDNTRRRLRIFNARSFDTADITVSYFRSLHRTFCGSPCASPERC